MYRQELGRARLLVEVEVADKVPEPRVGLADVGSRVRATVSRRIESLAPKEVIFDESDVGVVAEDLMIDEAAARVWADHQPGHSRAQPEPIQRGWHDVVVEPSPRTPDRPRQRADSRESAGGLQFQPATPQTDTAAATHEARPGIETVIAAGEATQRLTTSWGVAHHEGRGFRASRGAHVELLPSNASAATRTSSRR